MGTFTKPASEFYDMPVVREHLELAAQEVAACALDDFKDEMSLRLQTNWGSSLLGANDLAFDSPLEALFWIWWNATMRYAFGRENYVLRRHVFVEVGDIEKRTYNFDLVVASKKDEPWWPLVGIELDGHAFHEKTLEQVTYRNQRDRALQAAGWKVFHYSWDEFTRDPSNSVAEIVIFIRDYRWAEKLKQSRVLPQTV